MKPRVPASKYKNFIEFVEFLRSKNALCYFERAPSYIFSGAEGFWLSSAFIWFDMPEGYEFWEDLDIDWNNKLQREQNR